MFGKFAIYRRVSVHGLRFHVAPLGSSGRNKEMHSPSYLPSDSLSSLWASCLPPTKKKPLGGRWLLLLSCFQNLTWQTTDGNHAVVLATSHPNSFTGLAQGQLTFVFPGWSTSVQFLRYMVTVNCFVLYVIDWGVGIVRWWTISRLRQWNCKWCLVISSFHEPSCLHWFCDANIIRPCQFSYPFVLLFSLVATYFLFISEDRPIANDVFASYDLLVVLLLSTPHCRWCFCSYPSVSIHANTQVQHHVALPPGFMGKRGYILPLLVGTVCRLAYVVSVLLHLI